MLCEGPSILELGISDLADGPVIAVNHALAVSLAGVPIDVWATSDDPHVLWEWSGAFRPGGVRFFSTEQNILEWKEILGPEGLRRLYTTDETVLDENPLSHRVILPTLIPLLGWLLRLEVQYVRLIGADMQGTSSPIAHEEYSEVETPSWRWRWRVERTLLAEVHRLYRAQGARIERWRKPRPRRK